MSTPSGILAWGQAGSYDAVDDRAVIAALAGRAAGLVVPPTLTPGAGLAVNIGRWSAIVDAGDGTKGVIGSRDAAPIAIPAGGASVRTDVIWADIDPDAGTWTLDLYTPAQAAGRAGVSLGTVTVPPGANSSAAMDLRPGSVRLSGAQPATFPNTVLTQAAWTTLASFTIPANDAVPGAIYELELWGNGQQASTIRQTLGLRGQLGGQIQAGLTYGTTAYSAVSVFFRMVARLRVICMTAGPAGTFRSSIESISSEFETNLSPTNNNMAAGFSCESVGFTTLDTTQDQVLNLQGQWGAVAGNPTFTVRVVVPKRING